MFDTLLADFVNASRLLPKAATLEQVTSFANERLSYIIEMGCYTINYYFCLAARKEQAAARACQEFRFSVVEVLAVVAPKLNRTSKIASGKPVTGYPLLVGNFRSSRPY